MNFVQCSFVISILLQLLIRNVSSTSDFDNATSPFLATSAITRQHRRSLSEKLLDHETQAADSNSVNPVVANEYGEFQLIQSNVLQVKTIKPSRTKRDFNEVQNSTTLALPQNTTLSMVETRSRNDKKYKHGDKKKKKKKKGLYHLIKKMQKELPKMMKKMMPKMKMSGMFMLGMAQANLHNFVMHALMMSKMALGSIIMMIIRELVFGDKDEPVKYYNFGYDAPPRRRIITTIEHPVWKKRRRRHT